MRAAAVIVAGGSGTRMAGAAVAKQYLDLLGAPVLLWSVRAFLDHPQVQEVVVVLPAADAADPPGWLAALPVRITAGGASRAASVRAGLAALTDGVGVVLVHDAARPLVSAAVIGRVLHAAHSGPAIAAVPIADTVKVAGADGTIARTLDRDGLWLAQTPQGFPLGVLREAHRRASADDVAATDDAALCERYGSPVRIVDGAVENMKITRAADLPVVEALAAARSGAALPNLNTGLWMASTTYNVLFVCTGNTCRSPMAEALAREEIARRGWRHVAVASAGTAADAGAGAAAEAVAAMERRGVDLSAHEARRLTPDLVAWADLVLAMGYSHLRAVAALGGDHKVSLLGDFAAGERGAGSPIPDPFGGDDAVYEETVGALSGLVSASLDRISPIVEP